MEPVIIRSYGSLRNEVTAGKHQFVVDEPVAAGGTDEGPTPYDLLCAALGACTSMTMHVVAKRESIPLEAAEVSVAHDRLYAKDCADCLSKSGFIHSFDVTIRLRGSLTPAQRDRLLDVARRCPVYKTLSSEIRINETSLES